MSQELSAPLDDFKDRELEILSMMADGLSNREIADKLFITKETVRWYNKQIYSKLGTSRRTEAVALARRFGLIGSIQAASADEHPPFELPVASGPFIGRDAVLDELAALLNEPDVRLLSIIAAGGMGKSRLSLELAHRLKANYERGAAFIDLTRIQQPDDIVRGALASLGIMVDKNQHPNEALLNFCRKKQLLLIFDNMEHLMPGAPLLADLLAAAPDVKIIATSRERLNLRLETVYDLPPVTEAADKLFIEVAAIMRHGVTFDDDDHAAIQRIVELVGGMPLALILAAAWVDMLSVQEIADEIQRSLDFLSVEFGDMPPRQRSIRAVINPTWERLSEAEQQAFMWVSVFRGGFTLDAFRHVTGASVRMLQKLVGRSLVMQTHKRRYDMHPLLRQYAYEKLEASGAFEQAATAHLQMALDDVQAQNAVMFNGQYMAALDHLDAEQDNYRAALDWSLAGAMVEPGAQLAIALCEFWEIRTHSYEAEHYLTTALQRALPDALRAPVLCWRSRFHYRLGRLDAARADAEAALALAEAQQDQAVIARSLLYLSILTPADDDLAERASRESDISGDRLLIAKSLNNRGILHAHRREYTESLAYYEQAREIYESLGDLRGVSMVVYNEGLNYEQMQAPAKAREHFERSLAVKHQIGDRAGAARRLSVLAYNDMMSEEFEQAVASVRESRQLLEEVGDRVRWTYTLTVEASLAFIMTNFQQAQVILEQGLAVAQEVGEPQRLCEYYNLLGIVHLNQNDLPQAEAYFTRCFETAAVSQRAYGCWLSLMGYALLLWRRQQQGAVVELMAVAAHFRSIGSDFDRRYVFDPHAYRVEKRIGAAAWQAAQQKAAETSLEAAFERTLAQVRAGDI